MDAQAAFVPAAIASASVELAAEALPADAEKLSKCQEECDLPGRGGEHVEWVLFRL